MSGLGRTGRPEKSAAMLSHTFAVIRAKATNGKAKSQNAAAPAVNADSTSKPLRREFFGETSE